MTKTEQVNIIKKEKKNYEMKEKKFEKYNALPLCHVC